MKTYKESLSSALWPAILLAATVFALYFPSRGFDFQIVDDPEYVLKNDMVRNGLSLWGIKFAFTSVYESYWIPVSWLSLMADAQLWGLKAGGFHLTNAIIHAANALLLFIFLKKATGSTPKSLLAAALFAFHPLRVESVAWITARKDLLAGFFLLLALLAWLKYAKEGRKFWYAAALAAITAGLMSKPILVVAPFLLFALDIWPLERLKGEGYKKIVVEKLPFAALALVFATLTLFTQNSAIYQSAASSRPATVASTYAHYLAKTFWPFNLVIEDSFSFQLLGPAAALAFLALMAALKLAAWIKKDKIGAVSAGWIWFLASLLPVCGILSVGVNTVADRFTYIPHMGLMAGLVWGADHLISRRPSLRPAAVVAGAAVSLLLACLSYSQLQLWKDTYTLFSYQVKKNPSAYAETILAMANAEKGNYAEAIRLYESSFAKNPNDPLAYRNLGVSYGKSGRYAEALEAFRKSAAMLHQDPESHYNMAVAAYEAGEIDLALQSLDEALARKPDHFKAQYFKGAVLARYGKLEEALAALELAVELRPRDSWALVEKGETLGRLGRYPEAIETFGQAIAADPQNPAARFNAGLALHYTGKREEAAEYFASAFLLAPQDSELLIKYAILLEKDGDREGAAHYYRKALAVAPSNQLALEGLGRTDGK